MSELLLELFSEEIPAFLQKTAEEGYTNIFSQIFAKQEIFAKVEVFSGPRRITIHITHLPKVIVPQEIEIKGPKVGAPDAAIQGFCTTYNVNKLQLATKVINDKLYYFFVKKVTEENTEKILPNIIITAINKYIWPKSMYWGNYSIKWVRPLQNILCIFDDKILPIKFAHLTSNNISYGHRLIDNKKLIINNFADYKNQLLENGIILERIRREEVIKDGLLEIANFYNLFLKEDEKLIEEVAGIAEFPVVMHGKIPDKFLTLPQEVLISSMRNHQKYFCLFDKEKNIMPYFLFVTDGKFSNPDLIIKGNEKVLSARLSDALYFYEQDVADSLDTALIKLKQVIFHKKLGNLQQKIQRLEAICHYLAPNNKVLHIAARLCKSDLVSEMVGEFPELQGIMGYYYAIHEGLSQEIAIAIRDHYKPQGLEDNVPNNDAALLAIADKLDNLIGLMLAGEAPTGSGDPYALRRQALGIIRIIFENNIQINILSLFSFIIELYKKHTNIENIVNSVGIDYNDLIKVFFEERLKNYFKNDFDISLINAVLALRLEDNLVNIKLKLIALQKFLANDVGNGLLIAYKRTSNILGDRKITGEINSNIFVSQSEKDLFNIITKIAAQIAINIDTKDYSQALILLSSLLIPISNFFDNVLVNDDNTVIANNRLLLLQETKELFHQIANFSDL